MQAPCAEPPLAVQDAHVDQSARNRQLCAAWSTMPAWNPFQARSRVTVFGCHGHHGSKLLGFILVAPGRLVAVHRVRSCLLCFAVGGRRRGPTGPRPTGGTRQSSTRCRGEFPWTTMTCATTTASSGLRAQVANVVQIVCSVGLGLGPVLVIAVLRSCRWSSGIESFAVTRCALLAVASIIARGFGE